MIVTIHQPNFAPWTGFFDKLAKSDVFVLLDTVPYTKGGYQNRVRILGPNGPQWLTVPVLTKGLLGQPTNQVRLNEAADWRETHRKTLQANYAKAPHIDVVRELLEAAYALDTGLLVDVCVQIIEQVVAGYGFATKLVKASGLAARGSSSELLAAIVEECGGDVYLSGPSGRNYLDAEVFERAGIAVDYHSFTPPTYPQGRGELVGGLSILDAIAHLGWGQEWRSQEG